MNDDESLDQFIGQQASMVTHNRRLMAQMDDRMRDGFDARLQDSEYVVILSSVHGVMSVLAASRATRPGQPLFGPASFALCIEFVNATVVTRTADYGDVGPVV